MLTNPRTEPKGGSERSRAAFEEAALLLLLLAVSSDAGVLSSGESAA
jgi:hypothetical protein